MDMNSQGNGARLASLDVARGLDMLWIMGLSSLVVSLCGAFGYGAETAIARQMEHPDWHGFHFIDLVFPTFIFIAGISFPFSLAKQRERGLGTSAIVVKIFRRAIVLSLLGFVYNGALKDGLMNVVWGSVLARIGIAWGAAALLTVFCGVRMRLMVAILILTGYWAVCVFLSAPDRPGASPLSMEGCFSGWIDRMLLPGKLTVPGVITYQGVLSTIPAISTALFGIFTGEYVRNSSASGERKSATMAAAALGMSAVGLFAAYGCGSWSVPLNKILWSTSFTLVAAACSLALFTACYFLIDVKGWWRRTLFFRVIGLNALTIYLVQRVIGFRSASSFLFGWVGSLVPSGWSSVVVNVGYIAICWTFLYLLHKHKIYLKI